MHISIHAPRVGSDCERCEAELYGEISIHAPRVGSDHPLSQRVGGFDRAFQSTLPAWGATAPLAVAGGLGLISIHAPRVGSDETPNTETPYLYVFQSTLPAWGATEGVSANQLGLCHFNPRSPRGERPAGRHQ